MNAASRSSSPSARWLACVRRDPSASSEFVYAVTSTRIYCRPDCGSRLARHSNIAFYNCAADAEEAGFRACKRCRPDQVPEFNVNSVKAKIERAVMLLKDSTDRGETVRLADLAKEVGMSKWHFLRVFKKIAGVTPCEMCNSRRTECPKLQELDRAILSDSFGTKVTPNAKSNSNTTLLSEDPTTTSLDWSAATTFDYLFLDEFNDPRKTAINSPHILWNNFNVAKSNDQQNSEPLYFRPSDSNMKYSDFETFPLEPTVISNNQNWTETNTPQITHLDRYIEPSVANSTHTHAYAPWQDRDPPALSNGCPTLNSMPLPHVLYDKTMFSGSRESYPVEWNATAFYDQYLVDINNLI